MKFKPTMIAVIIFIIVALFAAYSEVQAEDGFRISLGYTVANSTMPAGEFSYEYKGYELAAMQIGVGNTRNGPQKEVNVFSFSHIVRPEWYLFGARNYYRIGVSHVSGSPLVGDTNFRLGIGFEWKIAQVEYFHFSSAGIHQPNTGIDGIALRFKF